MCGLTSGISEAAPETWGIWLQSNAPKHDIFLVNVWNNSVHNKAPVLLYYQKYNADIHD